VAERKHLLTSVQMENFVADGFLRFDETRFRGDVGFEGGMRVEVIGAPAQPIGGRRVVFVSNHSSWLDIPILGGTLEACFISKDDVASWPLVSTVAKLGRTVFVSRQRGSTARTQPSHGRRPPGPPCRRLEQDRRGRP